MPTHTSLTEYELRDLATGSISWFESIDAARLEARELTRWQIVHAGNNVVGYSHPQYWRPRRRICLGRGGGWREGSDGYGMVRSDRHATDRHDFLATAFWVVNARDRGSYL